MAKQFIRTNIIRDRTMATETIPKDLPVNPLSHLIVTMSGLNATDEATLTELLSFMNSVKVQHNGVTVTNLQSEDLYGLNCYLYNKRPVVRGKLGTDNYHRAVSLMVPFGRRIFDHNECYPATRKGEFTLHLDTTVPATSWDNAILNVEAIEMPGATPERYLKAHQRVVTAPGATGENEVELPIGHDIACIQMRMTTFPTTSSQVYGVVGAKILKDNVEWGYSFASAHALVGDLIHHVDTQHGNIAAQGLINPLNVVYLDFDPRRDLEWLLETAGLASVKLTLDMGVDEATTLGLFELPMTSSISPA